MAAARLACQRRPSKRATAAARLAPTPSQANARMRAAVVLVPVESSRGGRAGQNARAEGAPRALVLVLLPRGCPTPDSFPGGLKRPGAVDGPPRAALRWLAAGSFGRARTAGLPSRVGIHGWPIRGRARPPDGSRSWPWQRTGWEVNTYATHNEPNQKDFFVD